MPYNPKTGQGGSITNAADRGSSASNTPGAGYTNLTPEDTAVSPQVSAKEESYFARNCNGIRGLVCTPLNVLLIFVPLGVYAGKNEFPCLQTFSYNFIAIVPLAGVLGASTEQLAGHTGQMIGGLLNATFGNAVEMIVTINAIKAGLVGVVQASLIGSILSNLLLVMGMAFVASHIVAKESSFNLTGAATNITCLVLASSSLILPTVFSFKHGTSIEDTVHLSRACAIVMAFVYVMFLVFQLRTHADLFVGEEEEEETPEMDMGPAMAVLFLCTCAVAYCSEFLVDSIEDVSEKYGMPQVFIGTILLPIVGNAAEHTTAVTAAMKGKMDLALGVAVGSSTQIALFVVPFSVIIGWIYDVNMSLDFEVFMATVFLLSVFIASSVLGDGSANWFEGVMLVASYTVVAIVCWFIPPKEEQARALRSIMGEYKVYV